MTTFFPCKQADTKKHEGVRRQGAVVAAGGNRGVEYRERSTWKMSLRGVVENLVATPSSQDRAFCSDTPGAAETMSEPTDANPLAAAHSAAAGEPPALLASADAIALLL